MWNLDLTSSSSNGCRTEVVGNRGFSGAVDVNNPVHLSHCLYSQMHLRENWEERICFLSNDWRIKCSTLLFLLPLSSSTG
jgi:hypothetical protein